MFCKNQISLPYLDIAEDNRVLCLLTTVQDNLQGVTKNQAIKAAEARKDLLEKGYPTEWDFTNMVHKKMNSNYQIK